MVEFKKQGTTVMSEVHCETLKLRRASQNKRHGMLTSGVVLLHGNEHLHALEHCWSISAGSCLSTLLTSLILRRVTTTVRDRHMTCFLQVR
jgi:hypothetical protein